MSAFTVKGVRIGEGRPKTIVSLMGADEDELLREAARAVEAGADCVEWRVDFARDVHDRAAMAHVARALGAALPRTPLVFTFRSSGQGGRLELDPEEYAGLLREAMASGGVDIVDVELGIGYETVRELVTQAHEHGVRALVSYHDFAGTPSVEWMRGCLVHMASLGADLPKIAVMARTTADCLHLMEATSLARDAGAGPLVTMAMGAAGSLSRLAGEAVGSALTFCALEAPSAPGQVALETATRILDELHGVAASTDELA